MSRCARLRGVLPGGAHLSHWAIALEEAVAALRAAAGAGDAPDWRSA